MTAGQILPPQHPVDAGGLRPVEPWTVQRPVAPAPIQASPPSPPAVPLAAPPPAPIPVSAGTGVAAPAEAPVAAGSTANARLGGSRTASMALVLAALVAAGGVSFAVGRWSAESGTTANAGVSATGGAAISGERGPGDGSRPAAAAGAAAQDEGGGTQLRGEAVTDPAEAIVAPAAGGRGAADAAGAADARAERRPAQAGRAGRGGLVGTLAAVGDGAITLTTPQGDSQSITTDTTTSYVSETELDAAAIAVGDGLRVQFARGGRAAGDGAAPTSDAAVQVTVVAPGVAPTDDLRATEGIVEGVADGGIVITLADGSSSLVPIDDATRIVRTDPLEPTTLQIGDQIRVQLPFTGPGNDSGDVPLAASQVTLLADTAA